MPSIERLRAVIGILLLIGAALFIVGVAVERAAITHEQSATQETPTSEPSHLEGSGTEGSGTEGGQPATAAPEAGASEAILGVNVESWPLAIVAAVLSIGAAFVAWRVRQRVVLVAIAVFALAFAALDIREAVHQGNEGRTGILVLAIFIAAVHLGASALAAGARRTEPQANPA